MSSRTSPHQKRIRKRKSFRFFPNKNFDCSSHQGSPEGLLAIHQVQSLERKIHLLFRRHQFIRCVINRRSLYLITDVLGSRRPCRRWLHENYAAFNRPWPSRVYLPIRLSDLPPRLLNIESIPSLLIERGDGWKTPSVFGRLFYTYFIFIFFIINCPWDLNRSVLTSFKMFGMHSHC